MYTTTLALIAAIATPLLAQGSSPTAAQPPFKMGTKLYLAQFVSRGQAQYVSGNFSSDVRVPSTLELITDPELDPTPRVLFAVSEDTAADGSTVVNMDSSLKNRQLIFNETNGGQLITAPAFNMIEYVFKLDNAGVLYTDDTPLGFCTQAGPDSFAAYIYNATVPQPPEGGNCSEAKLQAVLA